MSLLFVDILPCLASLLFYGSEFHIDWVGKKNGFLKWVLKFLLLLVQEFSVIQVGEESKESDTWEIADEQQAML